MPAVSGNGDKPKRRKFLTLADLDKIEDRPYVEEEIAEWGGRWIRIRPLSARQWAEIEQAATIPGGDLDDPRLNELIATPMVIAAALVDTNGDPLFTVEEADKFMDKNAAVVNLIGTKIRLASFAAMREQEATEAETIEAAGATFLAGEAGPESSK